MTERLSWLRLYSETVDNAKLKLLAFEDRWHFVAVLCCKAQGILDGGNAELRDRILGVKLGLAARELGEVKRRMLEVDLIDADWQPVGWDERQFSSDHDAAERKRRQRTRERAARGVTGDVTPMSRDGHGLEQSRAEQSRAEQREEGSASAESLALTPSPDGSGSEPIVTPMFARPKRAKPVPRGTRLTETFELTDARRAVGEAERLPDVGREFERFVDYWRAASGANARKHDWDATWRNWCRRAADGLREKQSAGYRPARADVLRQRMVERERNAKF